MVPSTTRVLEVCRPTGGQMGLVLSDDSRRIAALAFFASRSLTPTASSICRVVINTYKALS